MRKAITIRRAAAFVLALALPAAAAAQTLFFENFQTEIDPFSGEPKVRCTGAGGPGTYSFPSGWLLRNVDNRTPNAQTSYVNDAWEVREDFAENVNNCVAFSNSYYAPVGAANDWMWTPLIGPLPADGVNELSWRARVYDPLFPDGYEVRVMVAPDVPGGGTGVIGNQITNSTVVFSTAAEAGTWTTRRVDLSAYVGQSIYVGFRNPSNDKFLLVVDDVKVERIFPAEPELLQVAEAPRAPYARVPAYFGLSGVIEASVRNSGSNTLTGVTVDTDLLIDGEPAGSFSSTPIPTLTPGAAQTVNAAAADYTQIGLWTYESLVRANEGDDYLANSVKTGTLVEATQTLLSRAEGPHVGVLGIGTLAGGELGSDVDIPVSSRLYGVRVGFNNPDALPEAPGPDGVGDFNGVELTMLVRGWDPNANTPGNLLAQATTVVPANAQIGPLVLEFDFDRFLLPPGRYLLALQEPVGRTLAVQLTMERFADNTTWAIWPASGGWQNFEDFGPQFERTPDITAVVAAPIPVPVPQDDSFSVPDTGSFGADVSGNDAGSDEGGSVWTVLTPPVTGEVTMQVDGSFQFVPAVGSAGSTVSFVYRMCDADDDCADATVDLHIEVNTPIAQDDSFDVISNQTFADDVSTNDTPSDDGGNFWAVLVPPATGTFSMRPSGAFEYTPAAGDAGTTVGFSYRLCDVDQHCTEADVELQVGINVPVAQDDAFTLPPSGAFTGDVTLDDTLSEDGANVVAVVTPPASGTLTMQPSGAFSYIPDAGAAGTTIEFEYSLCDEDADCDTAQVQLSISAVAIFADSFEAPP